MVSTRGVKFKYTEGEKVLCYEPDPTKAKVLYDSKVLDLVVTRDSKGRKIAEYLVHFYGWNSSWDRCVQEDFVLSDNEENRLLQKRLAEEAAINLKGKKRLHKMGAFLKDTINKKKCSDGTKENGNSSKTGSKWQDSESSQDDETTDDGMEDDDTDEEDDEDNNPYNELGLTDKLKERLEEDCIYVTSNGKLLQLPAELTVAEVLESYVKQMGVTLLNPSQETTSGKQRGAAHLQHMRNQNKIHLNKEMVDGLRVCFDFTLPLTLLYKQEQEQFKSVISKPFVIKPKDNSFIPKFSISGSNLTAQSTDTLTNRYKERLPSSTVDGCQNIPQNKQIDLQCSAETDSSPSSTVTTHNRSQSRLMRGNQSPTNVSGDEGQRMHRVLRSTERLRLEEHQNRKSDTSVENESVSGPDSPTISFKQIPPGSPQPLTEVPQSSASSKGEASSASSSHSDSTVDRAPSDEKEILPDSTGLVNELMCWQLLPPHLFTNQNMPTPPSCVYGAHHLLRLFVKLPGYLNQMNIPKMKRIHLIKHLKSFIQYLDEKCDTLFPSSAYVEAQDST